MYRHLIFVHSALQLYQAVKIVEYSTLNRDPTLIVLLRGMQSYTVPIDVSTVDGTQFDTVYTRLPFRHWNENRRRERKFETAVRDRMTDEFTVYSSSYSSWYQQWAYRHAARRIVLEDGFGSLVGWGDDPARYARSRMGIGQYIYQAKVQLAHRLRYPYSYFRAMVMGCTADFYYHVSPLAFPSVAPDRKQLLTDVFPPLAPGEYDGTVVWCLSACVETNLIDLSAYLRILERTVSVLQAKGYRRIAVKFHPRQVLDNRHIIAYRRIICETSGLEVREISPAQSVESLAAGSDLRLLVGYSSLLVYVAAQHRAVYSYLSWLEEASHAIRKTTPSVLREAYAKLSFPVEQLPAAGPGQGA